MFKWCLLQLFIYLGLRPNKSADQANKVIICKLFHCRCAADDWRSRQDRGFPKPPCSGLASHFLPRPWHSLHTTHPLLLWARENVSRQCQLIPSYLCVEYMETWCFRRWMTSPEAPGLLTEAAGEWCARPQWWWTAGLGGARPGHRWAVGHCRPGQPTATARLRPHCTADQSFQRWNPLQTILKGPPTIRFSAEQKKHNWGHPTRDVISDGFWNE